MSHGISSIPVPRNEPVLQYAPHAEERLQLKTELDRQRSTPVEVPLIIGGERVKSGATRPLLIPHDHKESLGFYHEATPDQVSQAITAALEAAPSWSATPMPERAAIFLRAAHLLSTTWRNKLNASTMLNLSKTVYQAEIDAAAEMIDFLRFNAYFMQEIYQQQPMYSPEGTTNRLAYRALEGFVFAVTPFNFTSIAGNLPTAPAMMGNTVVWKPASSAVLPAYYLMELLMEAGLPKGVINLVPGKGSEVGEVVINHPQLAGIHFTGSTGTFNQMWEKVGTNLARGLYRSYPRIVGETGGKDFVLAAPDADPQALAVALFRGAFEYQGQKCSAASRAYIPASLWPGVLKQLRAMEQEILMGDISDFRAFMGAVIDEKAFNRISSYIEYGNSQKNTTLEMGGEYDKSTGWFIRPTVFVTTDPHSRLMTEEIFGPVLTVYVYDDPKIEETAQLVNDTSPYALTGAVFTADRDLIVRLSRILEHAAGNFYINDKPTGAVVGQQPFGGARGSGTNDK
ncbi:L-glutamate gamma-semialdehyde dehydrogenase, partial [Myxococcota bacterium]|nr:L-glutamate gamma-semialdehyde dehydrogenase [Myxococcota bacterium]